MSKQLKEKRRGTFTIASQLLLFLKAKEMHHKFWVVNKATIFSDWRDEEQSSNQIESIVSCRQNTEVQFRQRTVFVTWYEYTF